MKHNYKFFTNTDCEYYPCHEEMEAFNCLFCYCPLYNKECQGDYHEFRGIRDCSSCVLPHLPEGYDYIVGELMKEIYS